MIHLSHGITYAARNIHLVFCCTSGEVFPTHPPSVREEVFDCPLSSGDMTVSQVHLFQELVAPEEVSLEMTTTDDIPSVPVSPLDPEYRLSCHILDKYQAAGCPEQFPEYPFLPHGICEQLPGLELVGLAPEILMYRPPHGPIGNTAEPLCQLCDVDGGIIVNHILNLIQELTLSLLV